MIRTNLYLPTLAAMTFLWKDPYRPDPVKRIQKGLTALFFYDPMTVPLKKERINKVSEMITTFERGGLAFGIYHIAEQLKSISILRSRPILREGFCIGVQSMFSLPSALFSLAHKSVTPPFVPDANTHLPTTFYTKEFSFSADDQKLKYVSPERIHSVKMSSGKEYKFYYDGHYFVSRYFSPKPLRLAFGLVLSMYLLNPLIRKELKNSKNDDLGAFEGRTGLFKKIADPIAKKMCFI